MDAWKQWQQMAQGSSAAAQILAAQGEFRSSASRAYYAAYQSATALLLYAGQRVPEGREGWSHEATPDLLKSLPQKILSSEIQQGLTARVKTLYELRLSADYRTTAEFTLGEIQAAVRSAVFVIKIINSILPGE